eukprot:5905252-Amphidinium_carterae.1
MQIYAMLYNQHLLLWNLLEGLEIKKGPLEAMVQSPPPAPAPQPKRYPCKMPKDNSNKVLVVSCHPLFDLLCRLQEEKGVAVRYRHPYWHPKDTVVWSFAQESG